MAIVPAPAAGFSAGDGSAASPYQVATADHLNEVRNHLGAHFVQTTDIDLGVAPWNDGEGWVPIGTSGSGQEFLGTYDGGGFRISGLRINRPGQEWTGLFGFANGASFRNIRLENAHVTGSRRVGILAGEILVGSVHTSHSSGMVGSTGSSLSYTGGLVGLAGAGTGITSCSSSAQVHASGDKNWYSGGLVGTSRGTGAIILRCHAWGSVHTTSIYAGGLAGYNYQGSTIRESFATGEVAASGRAGGLVGVNGNPNDQVAALIEDSYATGSVTASSSAGALVGQNSPRNANPTILRSYAVGFVTPYAQGRGGLVGISGHADANALVLHSYFNLETTGMGTSSGGEAKSTLAMLDPATFTNWDFSAKWRIMAGRSYPYLAWQAGLIGSILPQPRALTAVPVGGANQLHWMPPGGVLPITYQVFRDGHPLAETASTSHVDSSAPLHQRVTNHVTAVYPEGASGCSNLVDTALHDGFAGGNGTPASPFQVATAAQLFSVRYHRSAHFIQTADISLKDFQAPAPYHTGVTWLPIGAPSPDLIFAGNYDGRGHWITELFCDQVVSRHAGLFGYVQGGLLRNIMLREATIHGLGLSPGVGTGGLVGCINGGEIHGCHAHGVIRDTGSSGTTYNLGGLVGYCVDSQIHRSSSAGTVSGSRSSRLPSRTGRIACGGHAPACRPRWRRVLDLRQRRCRRGVCPLE